jgi:hypothetical protein
MMRKGDRSTSKKRNQEVGSEESLTNNRETEVTPAVQHEFCHTHLVTLYEDDMLQFIDLLLFWA